MNIAHAPFLETFRKLQRRVAFHGFLLHLFEDISKRDELVGTAFDRRAAAASLRLYLGE